MKRFIFNTKYVKNIMYCSREEQLLVIYFMSNIREEISSKFGRYYYIHDKNLSIGFKW